MNDKEKSSVRKMIESATKHEDIVDAAVELGKNEGLDVEATDGNDPHGDIKVAKDDAQEFLNSMGETIDRYRNKDNT